MPHLRLQRPPLGDQPRDHRAEDVPREAGTGGLGLAAEELGTLVVELRPQLPLVLLVEEPELELLLLMLMLMLLMLLLLMMMLLMRRRRRRRHRAAAAAGRHAP